MVLLCDEFQSRRVHLILRSVLGAESSRVAISPLRDRRYSPTDWWTSRGGVRTVILGGLALAIAWTRTPGPVEIPDWDPDQYERSLRTPGLIASPVGDEGGWKGGIVRWLDIGQTPEPVDHVVLLPGNENTRPFVATALVKAGLARDILIPQNHPSPAMLDGLDVPIDDVIRTIVKRRGLDPDVLRVMDLKSDGTIEDAEAVRPILDAEPTARVAVVTSSYHTRRSRMAFRAVFGARADSFVYVSAPTVDCLPSNWWKTDGGAQMVLAEMVKLGIYWVAYSGGARWLGLAIAVLVAVWIWRRRRRLAASASSPPTASPLKVAT